MKDEKIREERISKANALREKGLNPYPHIFKPDLNLNEIRESYDSKLEDHEHTKDFYNVAGRIMLFRDMGGLAFATIQDESGKLQITFMKKELGDQYKLLKYFDLGDIIGVYGKVFKTKKGELSILVEKFEMLCKSLTDLGDKFHGVQDIEIKYRNRSLDMVMNPYSKDVIKKRFLITQKIREFMVKEGILEVETPITQTSYGGAAAKPFVTHHNDLEMDLFLRVSPEQSLKRIIAGDMRAVFEINKNFRNEDIDRTHNPEFTMLEAYIAYKDYNYTMDLLERMVEFVAKEVFGTLDFEFNGQKISFKRPWKKISVKEALKKTKKWDVDKMSDEELFSEVEKIGGELPKKTRGYAILALFEEYGEPLGVQPTHFIDYPKESTPLCKIHRKDEELIERFESFVCGMEISNSYTELNDGELQRKLFEEQSDFKKGGQEETWGDGLDVDFLNAIDLGMPPTAGIGIGIDRLCMVLLNEESIRDIIYFPTMKPKGVEPKTNKKKENKEVVVVVNKGLSLEPWQEANAIAHVSAMFAARKGKELFYQDKIFSKDNKELNLNIQYPIMIKKAISDSVLRDLIAQAEEKDIEWYPFTKEMIETTSDKKVVEWTKGKNFDEINLLAVLFFSNQKTVEELAKDVELM